MGPFLAKPRTRGRAITLTFDQFKYGWANALEEKEAKELYETFHCAGSRIPLVQMGTANLNPWTEAKMNTKNPDRGPLLIIERRKGPHRAVGDRERRLRQRRNPGATEIVKLPNRGHALTIDHGWQEVAQIALDFVSASSRPSRARRPRSAAGRPPGYNRRCVARSVNTPCGSTWVFSRSHRLTELEPDFEVVQGASHESLVSDREHARVVAQTILAVVQAARDRERATSTEL